MCGTSINFQILNAIKIPRIVKLQARGIQYRHEEKQIEFQTLLLLINGAENLQIRQNLNIGFFTNIILSSIYSVYGKVRWMAQDKLSTATVVVTNAMIIVMDFKSQ